VHAAAAAENLPDGFTQLWTVQFFQKNETEPTFGFGVSLLFVICTYCVIVDSLLIFVLK